MSSSLRLRLMRFIAWIKDSLSASGGFEETAAGGSEETDRFEETDVAAESLVVDLVAGRDPLGPWFSASGFSLTPSASRSPVWSSAAVASGNFASMAFREVKVLMAAVLVFLIRFSRSSRIFICSGV